VRVGSYLRALMVGLVLSLGWLPVASIQAQEQRYQGRTLSDWAGLLEDADPSTRLRAVDALRLGFGRQAVPVLIRAVEAGDRSVRIEAIRALGGIQPPCPSPKLRPQPSG